jgi:uncharacterized membrane-anchored protein
MVIVNSRSMLNKVPEVTLTFWLIKILSTTVGETGADYLAVHVGWGTVLTDLVMGGLLAVALTAQVLRRKYVPWIYWLTVVLVSIVGTQITDVLTDKLEVSLYLSTAAFSVALCLTFLAWYRSEGTLSIQAVDTRKRELFYWLAILFTFALGTAAGDLATEALGLGFKLGSFIFTMAIGISALAYVAGANSVAVFWVTYILARPLGAAFGDLLAQSQEYGGLGLGTASTSVIFLSIIVVLVGLVSVREIRRNQSVI